SNDFPLLELVPVSNSHEGIVWLGDRKIDVFIGDLLTTTQRIKREGLANIKIVGNTPYKIPRAFGVRKDMNAPLASILRSSLDSMSESERGTIINRWVSVQSDPMIDYSLLWKIGLLAATIVLLVLFMNYRLSKLVTKRTSDLSQANEALRASEASLNRAQEVAHIGSWHWDIAEDRVDWSDEVYRIFGIEKGATITHETFLDRIHPDDRGRVAERVASALRNGSEYEVEHRVIVDGKIRWIRTRAEIERNDLGEAVGALGISHDISDRKSSEEIQERLEEQLRQSQKMEAVGQLAGGVAHDFNNILQAIRGHTDLALQDVPIDSSIREDLEEISEASDRATGLVRQLLAFGRRDNLALGECNLNEAAENLMKMVRRLIGEHIDLVFNPGAEISTIQADRGQIEQIILNLSVNARDAMPEGGTLTIETETRHFDSGFKRENPMAREGTFVALHVKDTGSGIPREILDRIFEPFFTTKEVGKGTGLGLATVYAAVKNHDGFILLDSNRDSGTHFMICFPAAVATASSETSIRKITTIPQSGNGETLLLAEDEKPVRELAVRVLERAGYRVIAAVDGEDAMEKFDTYRDDIEIVIADVVMPKKSGRSVFDHVSAANPTLPFLFMTGHSYNILDSMPASEDRFHLLQKPFSPQELVERVAEVLASRTKTVAV
ncbi:MAG: PAS domain-containing protein, partial [Candidatus Omnitrophica bacterium]|nr:PAS domain-containing protein [Candidatus Omnitrophota bacterium]